MPGAPRDSEDLSSAEREEAIPTAEIEHPEGWRSDGGPLVPVSSLPHAHAPSTPARPMPRPVFPFIAPDTPTPGPNAPTTAATIDVPPPPLNGLATSDRPTVDGEGGVRAPAGAKSAIAGRYEIEATLGEGGMGAVYRVYDRELRRQAALKLIRSDKRSEKREKRFLLEARAMAKVAHPGCVQVFDVGTDVEGVPYLVMELVAGESLLDLIGRGELMPRRVALLLHQVAGALHCVHGAGLIHRDVKPHNILVSASGAKLADFGIVKDEDSTTSLTAEGAMIGTLPYMPPEQTARTGQEIDVRVDVYALGATLYHCLVGAPPFGGPQPVLLDAVLRKEPTPPRRLRPEIPRDLEAICLKCLAKDRANRYASAAELEADLGRFLADEPVLARPHGALERAGKAVRRQRKLAGLAAAGVVALAGVLVARAVVAGARARAELRRGDELVKARDFDGAAEAYRTAAILDPGVAATVETSTRRAAAGKLAADGEREVADARVAEGTAGTTAARGPVLAAEARAERAFEASLVLAPEPQVAAELVALRAHAYEKLAAEDPARAEALAGEVEELAKRYGLEAPLPLGTVAVTTKPAGAHVLLLRSVPDASGIERLAPVPGIAATTPTSAVSLPSGDYVAVVSLDGFFEARVPFVAARRSQTALQVSLVDRALLGARADGFVFVAGGPARVGPRLERVETAEDFLIERQPLTRAAWIDFLHTCGEDESKVPPGDPGSAPRGVTRELALLYAGSVAHTLGDLAAQGWEIRLPRAVELARACRGPFRRTFPWGERFEAARLRDGAPGDLSPLGVLGLAGGAAELTSELDPDTHEALVWGGAAGDRESRARAALEDARGMLAPETADPSVGFRLVIARVR